jgi:Mrp family chromosome partitioning ATPase
VDGVLFVVDSQKSRGRQVRRALEQLSEAGATVLGATINRVSQADMQYVHYLSYVPDPTPASDDSASATGAVSSRARSEAT